MKKRFNINLLFYNALANAILINLQLTRVISINWWLIFSPTWFIVALMLVRAVKFSKTSLKKFNRNF